MILKYGKLSHPPKPELAHDFVTVETARARTERAILDTPAYPNTYSGRGIVIPGGGAKYFPGAYVLIRMLRQFGCELPIQLWYIGEKEVSAKMRALVAPYGVECVDAEQVNEIENFRILKGWPLKAYAIFHSPFKDVLLLDADNVPTCDPTWLFDSVQFERRGAIFWPDIERTSNCAPSYTPRIWEMLGIKLPEGLPEFESAQVMIDKEKCWRALYLCKWFNEHSDFFYQWVYGDKETFNLAWRKTHTPFAMPTRPIHGIPYTLCQHDFSGTRLFQHRNSAKWRLGRNKVIPDFWYESDCVNYLRELDVLWDGTIGAVHKWRPNSQTDPQVRRVASELMLLTWIYRLVGGSERVMRFEPDGTIDQGQGLYERVWDVQYECGNFVLYISSEVAQTCRLVLAGGVWRGDWEIESRPTVNLLPR